MLFLIALFIYCVVKSFVTNLSCRRVEACLVLCRSITGCCCIIQNGSNVCVLFWNM